jgi:hypothetical protein
MRERGSGRHEAAISQEVRVTLHSWSCPHKHRRPQETAAPSDSYGDMEDWSSDITSGGTSGVGSGTTATQPTEGADEARKGNRDAQ